MVAKQIQNCILQILKRALVTWQHYVFYLETNQLHPSTFRNYIKLQFITLMLMKFIPLSWATTPANKVFPVPGAPYNKIPVLCRMGRLANNSGY